MYKEKCEEEAEIEEERKKRARIKVFGEEPPQAESLEFEEEIKQEEEYEPPADFGLSNYLIAKPCLWLLDKYKAWKYTQEVYEEM